MPRYKADSKERVRDAIDFVELVNARTELRKSGQRRYTGLCPFHDERTPSFGIDPVEKLYHCFGCGEGGDVFKFVMETEGLDFQSALESLAERAGVELEAEAGGSAGGRAARPRAAPARRCSTAPRPTTCASCGSRRRRPTRASTCSGAASPRARCASSASATRRRRGTRS